MKRGLMLAGRKVARRVYQLALPEGLQWILQIVMLDWMEVARPACHPLHL
jgi:hypothetical protein